MKWLFTITSLLLSLNAYGECPHEFTLEKTTYCLSMEWGPAEILSEDQFIELDGLSPVLNPMRATSREKKYSQARFSLWKKNDLEQKLLELPGFTIVPFMIMGGGHHSHGTASAWDFHNTEKMYYLSQVSFTEMNGCWELRAKSSPETKTLLWTLPITDFENLTQNQRNQLQKMCPVPDGVSKHKSAHNHGDH